MSRVTLAHPAWPGRDASVILAVRAARNRLRAGTDRQHQRRVDHLQVAIQRHVAVRVAADKQFTPVFAGRPADQRIAFQHIERADDLRHPRVGIGDLVLAQVRDDQVEVIEHGRHQLDPRHFSGPASWPQAALRACRRGAA
jgi:hypothetical protein